MNISTVYSAEKATTQRVIYEDDEHEIKKEKSEKIDSPKDNSYSTTQKVAIVAGAIVLGTVCIGGLMYLSGAAFFGGGATVAVGTSSTGGAAVLTTGGATVTKGALATKALLAAQAAAATSAKAAAATKAAAIFASASSAASTAATIGGVEAGKAAFITTSLSFLKAAAPVAAATTKMKVAGTLAISATQLTATTVGAVAVMESAKAAIVSAGSTETATAAFTTEIISSLPSATQTAATVASSVNINATSQLAIGTSALTINDILSKIKLASTAENALTKISQSYQQSEFLAKLNGFQVPIPDQMRTNFMNKLAGISETSPNSPSRAMLLTLCGALGANGVLPQDSAVPHERVIESDVSVNNIPEKVLAATETPEQAVVASEQDVISNQQPINFKSGMIYQQLNERVFNEAIKTASLRTQSEILKAALDAYPRTDFSLKGIYHGALRHMLYRADPATEAGKTTIRYLKAAPAFVGIAAIAAATMGTSIPFTVPAVFAGISCELYLHDRQYSQAALAALSAAPGCGTHFKAVLDGEGGLGRLAMFSLTRIAKIASASHTLSGGPGSTFINRAEYLGALGDVITESQPHRW